MSYLVHFADDSTLRIGGDPSAWWRSLRERIEHHRQDPREDAWSTSLVSASHYSQAVLVAIRGGRAEVLGRSVGGGITGSTHGPDLQSDASIVAFLDEVARRYGARVTPDGECGFGFGELASTQVRRDHRYVVYLVAGYGDDDGVTSAEEAVRAALEPTRNQGARSVVWHVFDRETGSLTVVVQNGPDRDE